MRKVIKLNIGLKQFSVFFGALCAICSMSPWFTWIYPIGLIVLFIFIILRIPFIPTVKFNNKDVIVLFFLVLFTASLTKLCFIDTYQNIVLIISSIIPLGIIILFSEEEKYLLLRYIIRIYSILLLISLIGFILKLIGLELPSSVLYNGNSVYLPFKNYYLFVINQDFGIFTRFASMMVEPGHVGMTCAFLLYINKYTLRSWENVVMTISLIWTFSLAGYAIYFVGICLHAILSTKNHIKTIAYIIFFCFIVGCASVAIYNSNNDSLLSAMIFARLESDGGKGIKGNNRNTPEFESFYDKFVDSENYYWGLDPDEFRNQFGGTPNSSYKNFIVERGIVSLILLLIWCIIYIKAYPSKLGFGLLLLFSMSFIQRPYFLWTIQSFVFVCGTSYFYSNKFTYSRQLLKLANNN
ncbi:MAG: hypothetical protein HDS07_07225 [Bacteroides sp.]|nr:hypothetical protein [Bacteroides sp.]